MRQKTMKALGTQPFFPSQHKLNKSTAQTNSLLLLALVQNRDGPKQDTPKLSALPFKVQKLSNPHPVSLLSLVFLFYPTKKINLPFFKSQPLCLTFHGYL